jgi:cell division protein FtsQ
VSTTTSTPDAGRAHAAKPKAKHTIDPRMRARRIAVRRDEGRRRLRRLLLLVAAAALLVVGYLLTRSPLLDVDHVRVEGAQHTDVDVLLTASRVRRGAPMTDVDLKAARKNLTARPWIDSVRVTRHWPGTVTIRVVERQASAVVHAQGTWVVVDRTGRVLDQPAAPPADLAVIELDAPAAAPATTQEGLGAQLSVAELLTPDLRAWVTAILAPDPDNVELRLQGGIRVLLGSQVHLSDKIVDLATVLTRVDLRDLETIDLKVVHSPVLTRHASAA